VPAVYRTEINDVLLTALVQTFTQWTKDTPTGGSGGTDEKHPYRFIADNRLVYNYLPSAANFGGVFQPGEALKAIKEQLRSVPNRGIGYGVRYLRGTLQ